MRRLSSLFACTALALALAPAVCLADEAPSGDMAEPAAVTETPTDVLATAPGAGEPDADANADPAIAGADASAGGDAVADAAQPEPASAGGGDVAAQTAAAPEQPQAPQEGLVDDDAQNDAQNAAGEDGGSLADDAADAPDGSRDARDGAGVASGAQPASAEGADDSDGVAEAASNGDAAASTPREAESPAAAATAVKAATAKTATSAASAAKTASTTAAKTVATASAKTVALPKAAAATTVTKASSAKAAPKQAAKKTAAKKTASGAAAALVNNAVYYISSALAKKGAFVVSAADTSGKAKVNVVLAKKAKQLSQYWRAVYRGNGTYRFVNYSGGYYLAVKGAVKAKANVQVAKSGVLDWKLQKNSDGTFSLKPAKGKAMYLSVQDAKAKKGANIRLWDAVANKGQKFTFTQDKRLTKVRKRGQAVASGVVKVSVAGTKVRVGIAGDSLDKNAQAATAADSAALSQVFQLRYAGNGLYELQNANSRMALSVPKGVKKAGAKVVQAPRTQNLNQMWFLDKTDAGFRLKNAKSGLALDVSGGKAAAGKGLVLKKASDAATQRFSFTQTRLVQDGTYVIQSAKSLPFVLAVKGNSKENGANVQINRSRGLSGEKFAIKYLGKGVYRITNAATKKSIDVDGASKKDGANVQMGAATGKASQKWVVELGDYGIMFKSAASGKYLNVTGKQAKNGVNVTQAARTGDAAQGWNLLPANWKFFSGASRSAMKYISKAETYEGWRYQWGGRSPSRSFDCAGLVMYCANTALGRSFDLMNTNAEMLYGKLRHISASEAKPGDLVFYRGTYGSDVNYISHVVIYVGNGYMYGAGDPIGYAPVDSIKNIYGKKATAVYARL